jgi:hypothetical protein
MIDIEGVENYKFEHLVCSHHGQGNSKKVTMIVTSDDKYFEVDDHGKVILTVKSLTNAIIRYNEIKPIPKGNQI